MILSHESRILFQLGSDIFLLGTKPCAFPICMTILPNTDPSYCPGYFDDPIRKILIRIFWLPSSILTFLLQNPIWKFQLYLYVYSCYPNPDVTFNRDPNIFSNRIRILSCRESDNFATQSRYRYFSTCPDANTSATWLRYADIFATWSEPGYFCHNLNPYSVFFLTVILIPKYGSICCPIRILRFCYPTWKFFT